MTGFDDDEGFDSLTAGNMLVAKLLRNCPRSRQSPAVTLVLRHGGKCVGAAEADKRICSTSHASASHMACLSHLRELPWYIPPCGMPHQLRESLSTSTSFSEFNLPFAALNYTQRTRPFCSTTKTSKRSTTRLHKETSLKRDTGHVEEKAGFVSRVKMLWLGVSNFISLYWRSVKQFIAEVRLGMRLAYRSYVKGHRYSRAEKRKMSKAAIDAFKVLPFVSMTAVVGTEVTGFLAARALPQLLPSAFRPVAKKVDESLPDVIGRVLPDQKTQTKQQDDLRSAVGDSLHSLSLEYAEKMERSSAGNEGGQRGKRRSDAKVIASFLRKIGEISGQQHRISPLEVARVGPAFRRQWQLQQLPRETLIRMWQYMNQGSSEYLSLFLPTFVLVRRLRARIQSARSDDKDIHFEEDGVTSLSDGELVEACAFRGLCRQNNDSVPLETLRQRLLDWIQLSINRDVPSSLLIIASALICQSQLRLENEYGAAALKTMALRAQIDDIRLTIRKLQRDLEHTESRLSEHLRSSAKAVFEDSMLSGSGAYHRGEVLSDVSSAGVLSPPSNSYWNEGNVLGVTDRKEFELLLSFHTKLREDCIPLARREDKVVLFAKAMVDALRAVGGVAIETGKTLGGVLEYVSVRVESKENAGNHEEMIDEISWSDFVAIFTDLRRHFQENDAPSVSSFALSDIELLRREEALKKIAVDLAEAQTETVKKSGEEI